MTISMLAFSLHNRAKPPAGDNNDTFLYWNSDNAIDIEIAPGTNLDDAGEAIRLDGEFVTLTPCSNPPAYAPYTLPSQPDGTVMYLLDLDIIMSTDAIKAITVDEAWSLSYGEYQDGTETHPYLALTPKSAIRVSSDQLGDIGMTLHLDGPKQQLSLALTMSYANVQGLGLPADYLTDYQFGVTVYDPANPDSGDLRQYIQWDAYGEFEFVFELNMHPDTGEGALNTYAVPPGELPPLDNAFALTFSARDGVDPATLPAPNQDTKFIITIPYGPNPDPSFGTFASYEDVARITIAGDGWDVHLLENVPQPYWEARPIDSLLGSLNFSHVTPRIPSGIPINKFVGFATMTVRYTNVPNFSDGCFRVHFRKTTSLSMESQDRSG